MSYGGGGSYESSTYESYGTGWHAPIETLGPPPVSAPFGYAVRGVGRHYIGWRPAVTWQSECGCKPERRQRTRYDERFEARHYEQRRYEEHRYSRPDAEVRRDEAYGSEPRYDAAPIYVDSAPIYGGAPEVRFAPPVIHRAPPVHVRQRPVFIEPSPVYVDGPEIHIAAPDVYLGQPVVVQAAPVYGDRPPVAVQAPLNYMQSSEAPMNPAEIEPRQPPGADYSDDPAPGNEPPTAPPPRHNYRQEPGERG